MPDVENLAIIGSGPAGWTAALYAARANLDPVLFEGLPKQDGAYLLPGGQLMLTTDVENFPGYPEGVQGPQMMQDFRQQAVRFDTRVEARDVATCDFGRRPFALETRDASGAVHTVRAHAVIIATGATANWMGLENEQRLARSGGGVSACAVCDGALPIFRDQELVVVGGGDSAMEETSYLAKFASKVYVIHRRDELRASKVMQKRVLENPKCEVVWDSVVTDVMDVEKKEVTGVKVQNVKTQKESILSCQGAFIAIGHSPNTRFFNGKLDVDDAGYIQVKHPTTATNVPGIFACGDCVDHRYRQAISAAGTGCSAAIDAERYLAEREG